MTVQEQLCYITTRIEAYSDTTGCIGTGFFFSFEDALHRGRIFLFSNKHLLENRKKIVYHLTAATEKDEPEIEKRIDITISGPMSSIMYKHPNDNVDLCAIDLTGSLLDISRNGKRYFLRSFQIENLPTEQQLEDIDPITEVEMIGYPSSLWDDKHNMPLFRKCLTASRIDRYWKGQKEFLLDGACIEGSSGSPIVLYQDGHYRSRKDNSIVFGSRFFLLGVQYARESRYVDSPLKTINGQNVPLKASIDMPINIGHAINYECIKDIIDLAMK